MTGGDLRAVRQLYGETQEQFGRRLGYAGEAESVARKVRAYEKGERPVVGPLEVLVLLLRELHGKRRKPDASRR